MPLEELLNTSQPSSDVIGLTETLKCSEDTAGLWRTYFYQQSPVFPRLELAVRRDGRVTERDSEGDGFGEPRE